MKMLKKFRYANILLAAFLFAFIVIGKETSHSQEVIGQTQQPLSVQKSGIWSNPSGINVCWENANNFNSTERTWVREAVEQSWEKESNVRFLGWQQCPPSGQNIRIFINDERPHTIGLGTQIDGRQNGMVLNFNFQQWTGCQSNQPQCVTDHQGTGREYAIKVIAAHEFGHALGFGHESKRNDTPLDCQNDVQVRSDSSSSGDWYLTSYDAISIMNYCNPTWNNAGLLSDLDIEGVKFLYGGWRRFELAPVGSASKTGKIAVVSRKKDTMEAFWIGSNGSVQGAYWYEGSEWKQYQLAPAGSASTSGSIKVISRKPETMEVFWVGSNGSVQDAYWYENDKWKQFQLAPAGSASTNGGITAVSRKPETMEVFWVGSNGSVQDAYWYENDKWKQFQLAPAGSASTIGGITAVSRKPETMEVFWVGSNGSVQDAYWYENDKWKQFQLAPAGSASTIGGITAVSRKSQTMEVFWVGSNGSVQDAYWYDNDKWKQFELAPVGSASTSAGITAVSRKPETMEVFWVSSNGSVQDAYWYENGIWQRFELAPIGTAANGGSIASVSRISKSMEVFWIGNGSIQDAFWYEK